MQRCAFRLPENASHHLKKESTNKGIKTFGSAGLQEPHTFSINPIIKESMKKACIVRNYKFFYSTEKNIPPKNIITKLER